MTYATVAAAVSCHYRKWWEMLSRQYGTAVISCYVRLALPVSRCRGAVVTVRALGWAGTELIHRVRSQNEHRSARQRAACRHLGPDSAAHDARKPAAPPSQGSWRH